MTPDKAPLQVLAITGNHTLVIGLTFLGRPWDVTAHADPADVDATQADVIIVDLGTTQAALDILAHFTKRPPAVVIGTDPIAMTDGDRFMPRPFTLDELAATVDAAVTDHVGVPKVLSKPMKMPAPSRASSAAWVASRPPSAEPTGIQSDKQAGFWVLPGWAIDDVSVGEGRDRPLPLPMSASVNEPPDGDSDVSGDSADHDVDATPAADGRTSAAPHAVDANVESSVIDLAALEGENPPRKSANTVVRASQPREPEPDSLRDGALKRLRAMATRTRDTISIDPALQRDEALQRFAQGAIAGGELETLIRDMPVLRSVLSLAQVIVEEAHTELEADTTAYWQCFDDGFRVLASQGLSKVAQHGIVALDQPMLGEVHATGGGLLIDPVDAVQAAVAGIGGAHTESFMAAAIAVGEGRYGLLAVGRDRPLVPADLDRLIAIATEAAPGVAIAQLLRRVTGQVVSPDVHGEQDILVGEQT